MGEETVTCNSFDWKQLSEEEHRLACGRGSPQVKRSPDAMHSSLGTNRKL